MKAIFFILVAVMRYSVESAKIRATRRQWIQYQPPNRNIFPVQNQYYNWQYSNQKFPVYQNRKLVYSYIDPLGKRFNIYGGNIGAQTAYLNGQLANRGQTLSQIWPGSGQVAWSVNRGLIGQSGYQNWLNSFGASTVYKNLINGGNDLNLVINRDGKSENSEQSDYDIDIRAKSVPNPEQVNYSVKYNIQNYENGNTGVHGNQKVQFNIDKDESDSLISVTDHDVMNSKNTDVYASDKHKLDVSNVDSIQNVAKKVSIDDVENTGTAHNFIYGEGEHILTEDQTQNWAYETITENTVTVSDWNKDNVKNIHVDDEEIVHPETALPGIGFTSPIKHDIITDVEADNKENTGTESIIAESLLSTGQDSSVDRYGLNVADAHLQTQFKDVGKNIDITALLNNWRPPYHRNIYPVNRDNLNWVANYPFLVNGHNSMNVKPRVYPFGLPPYQQQTIRYNSPWSYIYQINQRPYPVVYPYVVVPKPIKWTVPPQKQNWTETTHSDTDNTLTTMGGLNSDSVKEIHADNEVSDHPVTVIPENDFTSSDTVDTITGVETDIKDNTSTESIISENINSDSVKEIHADNEESDHPVTVIPENDFTSSDTVDTITGVETDIKDNTSTESIISENIISTDDKSSVDRRGLYKADAYLQKQFEESSRNIDFTALLDNYSPHPYRNVYPVNPNNLQWETKDDLVNEPNRMDSKPRGYFDGFPLNQQHMMRYNMPWSDVYQMNQQPRPTHPYFIPRKVEWSIPSPEQVNNLVSRICFYPNVNVKLGYERFTPAKTRFNILKMLQMFGIRHLPPNIYNKIPPQNLDMEYNLDERRPFNFDHGKGAVPTNLYGGFPFLYQRPRNNDFGPINFPEKIDRYRSRPYVDPRELDIKSASWKSNEAPLNDANNSNEIDFTIPEFQTLKNDNVAKHDFHTTNQIGSFVRLNSENIMGDGHDTLEASENYARQLIVDIVADLIRFPSSRCYSDNVAKLLEEIKSNVDALKAVQCETH